jgi:hypothetical protein
MSSVCSSANQIYRNNSAVATPTLWCYQVSASKIYDSYEKTEKYIFSKIFQKSSKKVRKFQNFRKLAASDWLKNLFLVWLTIVEDINTSNFGKCHFHTKITVF